MKETTASIWTILATRTAVAQNRTLEPGCEFVVRDETNTHGVRFVLTCGVPYPLQKTADGRWGCATHTHTEAWDRGGVQVVMDGPLKDCAKGEYWCARIRADENSAFCRSHRCWLSGCGAESTEPHSRHCSVHSLEEVMQEHDAAIEALRQEQPPSEPKPA